MTNNGGKLAEEIEKMINEATDKHVSEWWNEHGLILARARHDFKEGARWMLEHMKQKELIIQNPSDVASIYKIKATSGDHVKPGELLAVIEGLVTGKISNIEHAKLHTENE